MLTLLGLALALGETQPQPDRLEPEVPVSAPAAVTPDELRQLTLSLGADAASAAAAPTGSSDAPAGSTNQGAITPLRPMSAVQSMNPDLALILDVTGAWFSEEEPLQGGGHDPRRVGFNLQQLELAIGAAIDPFLRFDANLVFSQFGVELEEAYATTLALPLSLQARAGQFLTRFGRINPTHPHTWSFVDQALVIGKFFGSEGSRGLGVELSWLAPTPWFAELIVSSTDAAGECCARSFMGATELPVRTPGDLLYTTALKQFFALDEDWSVLWGLSTQLGPNASGNANRTAILGTDVHVRFRPVASSQRAALTWTTEFMARARQVPRASLRDGGGYSQLVWNIDPEWETGVRYELVTGADGGDDPLDPAWTSERDRTSVQVTYYPSHFSRLRLQGSLDRPTWLDGPVLAVFLALEIVAGAHGAHAF